MDLLRMVLDARRISPVTGTNALTVKDTPERIDAASRLLAAIDKARPEVIIDVELLEVDRTRLQEYGLQFASPGSPGLDGGVAIAPDAAGPPTIISLQSLRNLTQADVLFANLPNLYYRLLKTDTNTRTLANPQLRTMEGITGAGAVRRTGAGAGHDVLADCGGRPADSADHELRLPEHRRQHRHHAAHASRGRGHADAARRGAGHFRHGLRRPADVRQPRDQHADPAARRRNQHARRPDSRRGAAGPRRHSRAERYPGGRTNLRAQPDRNKSVGHHPHADAAHHSGARRERGRSPGVPRRP